MNGIRARGLERAALHAAMRATGALLVAAILAGIVRVLPLISDPDLPAGAAAPFGRSILWLALEAAIAIGWPLGWGLALSAAVDRGEVRVYALLGRAPRDFVRLLLPQAIAFSIVLGGASWLAARDAREPGRILASIVESSRRTCAQATEPRTIPIPFLDARWLCGPERSPHFLLRPPRPQAAVLTARRVYFAPDVRDVKLEDVNLAMGSGEKKIALRVGVLELSRLPPLVASATFSPASRMSAVLGGAAVASFGLAWLVVRMRIKRRISAALLAAAAGIAAFGALRLLDRAAAGPLFLPVVPLAAASALAIGAGVLVCLRRKRATATH